MENKASAPPNMPYQAQPMDAPPSYEQSIGQAPLHGDLQYCLNIIQCCKVLFSHRCRGVRSSQTGWSSTTWTDSQSRTTCHCAVCKRPELWTVLSTDDVPSLSVSNSGDVFTFLSVFQRTCNKINLNFQTSTESEAGPMAWILAGILCVVGYDVFKTMRNF